MSFFGFVKGQAHAGNCRILAPCFDLTPKSVNYLFTAPAAH